MTDAEKEKIKLRATFLNGLAIGSVLVGVLTPITRATYDPALAGDLLFVTLTVAVCFFLGFILHSMASKHLERLDQ